VIEQVVIAICGMASVWLSQDLRRSRQRWACVFGLVAQPFWFYACWKAEQWGIFLLAFIYTAAWARGVYNFWIRYPRPRQELEWK
jgi:hypothetical protein